jgi:hypothetical protein
MKALAFACTYDMLPMITERLPDSVQVAARLDLAQIRWWTVWLVGEGLPEWADSDDWSECQRSLVRLDGDGVVRFTPIQPQRDNYKCLQECLLGRN